MAYIAVVHSYFLLIPLYELDARSGASNFPKSVSQKVGLSGVMGSRSTSNLIVSTKHLRIWFLNRGYGDTLQLQKHLLHGCNDAGFCSSLPRRNVGIHIEFIYRLCIIWRDKRQTETFVCSTAKTQAHDLITCIR